MGRVPRGPRRRPRPVQRRFTHREFLNEDEERDGPERPAFAVEGTRKSAGGQYRQLQRPQGAAAAGQTVPGDHPGN
nr:MAG TPA: hypothetical protein [Caudoviricetes sp.]